MDKCKHGFDHACLICGFTHIDGKKVWFDWAWQEQQKQIDELEKRMNIARGLINTNNEFSPIKFIKADLNKVLMFKQALEGGEV